MFLLIQKAMESREKNSKEILFCNQSEAKPQNQTKKYLFEYL